MPVARESSVNTRPTATGETGGGAPTDAVGEEGGVGRESLGEQEQVRRDEVAAGQLGHRHDFVDPFDARPVPRHLGRAKTGAFCGRQFEGCQHAGRGLVRLGQPPEPRPLLAREAHGPPGFGAALEEASEVDLDGDAVPEAAAWKARTATVTSSLVMSSATIRWSQLDASASEGMP